MVINRLRVGHSDVTHSYLLKKELPPVCEPIHAPLTVEHVLIGCSRYALQRKKYFNNFCSLEDLFSSLRRDIIKEFIKEIGIYRKL
jgi:hypothetical protein